MPIYYIKQYLVSLVIFLGIDSVWPVFIAEASYTKHIGHLMAKSPNLAAAGVFYLLNIIGLLVLVVNPAIQKTH